MSFFCWQDKFSVGVDAIDNDHRILVDLIDQLHEAFIDGHVNETVRSILDVLVDYTHTHFDREEQLMAAAGYPDLERHKAVHAELRRQVEEVREKVLSGTAGPKVGNELLAFLHDWLYFHILEQDKDYVPYMRKP